MDKKNHNQMTLNNNVLSYLKNTEFLKYVFEGTRSQLRYWRGYVARRPQEKDDLMQAKYILMHLDDMECGFSENDIETLKKRIQASLKD